MSLFQFIIAAVGVNVLLALSIFFLYTTAEQVKTTHLILVIMSGTVLNLLLAGYFIYTHYFATPTESSTPESSSIVDLSVTQLSHTPVWIHYTPLVVFKILFNSDLIFSHNNLNPTLEFTDNSICYRILRHTCRPITDIVSIHPSTTQIESRLTLHRYTITFKAGDALHVTVNSQNKEVFESIINQHGLSSKDK